MKCINVFILGLALKTYHIYRLTWGMGRIVRVCMRAAQY